jgi:peptidoglycan/xylan/chitin deacetylase (PgdA/CDA1 family)
VRSGILLFACNALTTNITIASIIAFLFSTVLLNAQERAPWNNKKCAVSLTYDDALNVQLDYAVPLLDSLGLKATFYVPGFFPTMHTRLKEWRAAAENGHELGNHTLFHPCAGGPGREWVQPDYDLNHYTRQRMVDEIRMANIALNAIDGQTQRTFAYPCGDTKAVDSSYVADIQQDFVAARGVEPKMQKIGEIDLFDIGCFGIDGQSGDQLIELVKKAMGSGDLLVFLFHGVGGEHHLNVSLEAHRELLLFLKQNEKDIWIAPLRDIADYIKKHQQSKE